MQQSNHTQQGGEAEWSIKFALQINCSLLLSLIMEQQCGQVVYLICVLLELGILK